MKIDGNNDIARSAIPEKSTPKNITSDTEFKDILKASVERSEQKSARIQTAPPPNHAAAIHVSPPSPATNSITIDRVDNLLNLLDQYRNQLADPTVTLRRIEPLLNTITKEKDQLASALERLPDEDALKDIVHRTLITASLEVIRYSRGDYIPT